MAELNIAIAEDNPLMLELLSSILEAEKGSMWSGKQTMEKMPIR